MGDFEINRYISQGATISKCEKYRYSLWREWRGPHDPRNWECYKEKGKAAKDGAGVPFGYPKTCLFIMLNPSTANANADDPTIRRCVGFAKRFKFERLEVVNLFAYRATDPAEILELDHNDDPVGPDNLNAVTKAASNAGLIIAGWGVHGEHLGQNETLRSWIDNKKIYCLGLTKDGHPRHPLYIKADAPLTLLP